MSWNNVGKITAVGYDYSYVEIPEDSNSQAGIEESTDYLLNRHATEQARLLELKVGDHVVIENSRDSYAGRSVDIRLAGISGRDLQKRLTRIEEALGLPPLDFT